MNFFYCALFLIYIILCGADDVRTGDIRVSSQSDANALRGATVIDGKLTIDSTKSPVNNWGVFDDIHTIQGALSIRYNPGVKKVKNIFPALQYVTGGIVIMNNVDIEYIDGFHALIETNDNVDVWYNPRLETLSGFENFRVCGWTFEIGSNPSLVTIPTYPSLHTIKSSLFILDNDALREIHGFQALEIVDWSFHVNDNLILTTICGFYNYFSNGNINSGSFSIVDNGVLIDAQSRAEMIKLVPC
jgi:Receptor L domain